MYNLKTYLKNEIEVTRNMLAKIASIKSTKFDGTMICKYRNGKYSYFKQTYTGDNKKTQKLIGNETNSEVITRKKQKYIEVLKAKLERNLVIMENLYPNASNCMPEDVAEDLPFSYRDINVPTEMFDVIGDDSFDFTNEPNPYKFNEVCTTTITGQKVRSKGEALIYNLLYSYGIKFYYEKGIKLKAYNGATETRYPDFTIALKNGKYLFWEHLGKTSDYDYCINFGKKLHLYQHNNILLGVNLITTADSENSCTFTDEIDFIIRNLILPICKMV